MSSYLLDTNILLDALNEKRGRKELLRNLVLQGHRLACCAIIMAEVYAGMQPHESFITDQFLASLDWYAAKPATARRAGRLRFDYARQGITLSLTDTLIAAISLEHDLILITGNRKHFPMPDLSIYPL